MSENEEVKTNGVEYLLGVGIKDIANKTFISSEELEDFLNGNFQKINKTKAMGFIQILQREYSVDLSDLKSKYTEYIFEHKPTKKITQPLIMEEVQSEKKTKGFFTVLFLGLAIGSIVYLVDKYELLDFQLPTKLETATTENSSEIKDAKMSLDIFNNDKKTEPKKVATEVKVATTSDNANEELNLNNILDDKKEKDTTLELTKQEKQVGDDIDLSQLNSDLVDKEIAKKAEDSIVIEDDANESEVVNNDAISNEIYVVPTSKVWMGTIDLETLKKRDFLAQAGKKIDIDGTKDQLLMVGHKFIKLYLNGELVKFKSRGPIRFSYINGELKEIKRREFNTLCKGRQW